MIKIEEYVKAYVLEERAIPSEVHVGVESYAQYFSSGDGRFYVIDGSLFFYPNQSSNAAVLISILPSEYVEYMGMLFKIDDAAEKTDDTFGVQSKSNLYYKSCEAVRGCDVHRLLSR